MDAIGRSEIAKGLVKDHTGQYIGFIFDVEKEQFAEVLEKELSNNINLITVFNKSEASQHMLQLAETNRIDTNELKMVLLLIMKIFKEFTGVKNEFRDLILLINTINEKIISMYDFWDTIKTNSSNFQNLYFLIKSIRFILHMFTCWFKKS